MRLQTYMSNIYFHEPGLVREVCKKYIVTTVLHEGHFLVTQTWSDVWRISFSPFAHQTETVRYMTERASMQMLFVVDVWVYENLDLEVGLGLS